PSPSFHPAAQTVRTATRTASSDLLFYKAIFKYTTPLSKQANSMVDHSHLPTFPVLGHFLKDAITVTGRALKY
ncbi:hypothetical protein L873DRAFT_1801450, partial [Choiromyces venosus 120613-1]